MIRNKDLRKKKTQVILRALHPYFVVLRNLTTLCSDLSERTVSYKNPGSYGTLYPLHILDIFRHNCMSLVALNRP